MKMKYGPLLALAAIGIIVYGGWFVFRNLRGSGPALNPASMARTEPSESAPADQGNTTGIPLVTESGISISVFAKDLSGPRALARDPSGTITVSIPSSGKVVALMDTDGDGISDDTVTVIDGLNLPHGVAFRDFKLYVAETDQVAVYDYDLDTKRATNKKKIVDLPGGGNHFTRTIGFGPDGKLYISVGSSCNACNEKDARRAKILVSNADGSELRDYATGLRNSVFFNWHPVTRELWATDMGRDLLGDNTPPEEVNIVRDGGFYGWPFCYGDRVQDRTFDRSDAAREKCAASVPPHITFQAHSAPLGLAVIPSTWPEEYRGDLLVAYHGSWNRSQPTGYKIARFDLDARYMATGETDFIRGWLSGNETFGRPVDLLFDKNGVLFVSDDKRGVVYRVSSVQP